MAVFLGDAEADRRRRLEVDLDEHRCVVADHPGVMARCDVDHRRRGEVHGAPVGVLEAHAAVDEEPGVGVHARVRTDERAEVGRPAHPCRVDRTLDACVTDLGDVDLHRTERLVDRPWNGSEHGTTDRTSHPITVVADAAGAAGPVGRVGRMVWLVVLLGIVAVAAVVAAVVTHQRLAAQRRLTADTEQRLADADGERAEQARRLEETAAARDAAEARANEATARADAGDARAVGVDADVLWALELLRSERTWRHSVAPGPDTPSVVAGSAAPLREALQIELDAAREEVGVEVELEADDLPEVTPAGALLALRAAQELLAPAVRNGELTTVQLRADGRDLVIAVHSLDQDDEPVAAEPLAIPASADIEPTADGVRIRRAIRPE